MPSLRPRACWAYALDVMRRLGILVTACALLTAAPALAAGRSQVLPGGFVGKDCSAKTAIPRVAYGLGKSFAGLRAEAPESVCTAAINPKVEVASGPRISWGYVSTIYGTCNPIPDGCGPPLDIQSAPECARNPRSYEQNPGFVPSPGEPEEPAEALPLVKLSPAPWIPASSVENGRRIEIYAGGTTVVIFADDSGLAHRAAEALLRVIARYFPADTHRTLWGEAHQPGNGKDCRHFRGSLGR
jgi:hypothetical protein